MSEDLVFIARLARRTIAFRYGLGYLYSILATFAVYGAWLALYSTLSFAGGPLSRYAWLTWIPVVALVIASAAAAYGRAARELGRDPILSKTGQVRGRAFGVSFAVSYTAATIYLALVGGFENLSGLVYSIAWVPALSAGTIVSGLLAESVEVEKGYLPMRISLYVGVAIVASFIASLLVASAVAPSPLARDWYWVFHGTLGFLLVVSVVLVSLLYVRRLEEAKWLEKGE